MTRETGQFNLDKNIYETSHFRFLVNESVGEYWTLLRNTPLCPEGTG